MNDQEGDAPLVLDASALIARLCQEAPPVEGTGDPGEQRTRQAHHAIKTWTALGENHRGAGWPGTDATLGPGAPRMTDRTREGIGA